MDKNVKIVQKSSNGVGGFVCFVAFIGALIYFFQQANSFGEYVMAFLKACVWPAILVYHLLQFLQV